MPGVVTYATTRVLREGDSTRRVVRDLNALHHVTVSVPTVLEWVAEAGGKADVATDFDATPPVEDFSGVLSVDGTFRGVKAKKNARARGAVAPRSLRVTRSWDGRLAAYWREGRPRRKSPRSSRS
jgi:hypothetical protein